MNNVAENFDSVDKPRDWDKAVSAAYLRAIGLSQKDAATGAGIGERTLHRYEHSHWWPQAQDEAQSRWLAGVRDGARRTLLRAMNDCESDPALALKVLERLEGPLNPKQTVEHTGPDGESLHVSVTHTIVDPSEG